MMAQRNDHYPPAAPDLEAIRLAFMEARERGEPVHVWLDRYPQYATQLIDLAVALKADDRPIEPSVAEAVRVAGAVRRTLERLASPAILAAAAVRVEEVQQVRQAQQTPEAAQISSPQVVLGLAGQARAVGLRVPELARRLRLPVQVLVSLDQGYVRLETVPRQFLQFVAEVVQCTVEALAASLRPAPTTAGMAFHVQGKPQNARQRSFVEEIEQAPGIDPAEKARWLAAAREEGLTT